MTYRARWSWTLAAPRDALWQYVADTDWVNAHVGLPRIAVRFEPIPAGGTRKFASFRRGPVVVEWEELPTIWRVPEFYTVERRYRRGPLRRFVNTTTLTAVGRDATRVDVDVELEAASPLLAPVLPLIAAWGRAGARRAFALAARRAVQSGRRPVSLPAGAGTRFSPLLQAGVDPAIVAALDELVTEAEDRDLVRMRPYALADAWGFPRRDVLRAFLLATRAGLLNLRWNVICPGCRGPTPGIDSLEALQSGYHCPSCNVPFDAIFDRSVEVTFNAGPLGRSTEEALFCIASPQRSAHVYAQIAPAAGARNELQVSLNAGSYDVNAIGVGLVPFVSSAAENAREAAVRLSPSGIDVPHEVGAGAVRFAIVNDLDRSAVVRIEDGRWPDTIVTAAQVTAMQEFRDAFSSEVLAPGLELGIESLAILFTDLVGSTAMYSKTGDAPAFRIVTDHFAAIKAVVAGNEGTIVKTIGDAVMAAFVDPAKCFDAAVALDASVRGIECGGVPLRLRVGFHSGPCIAMRANDRIDYFGTNVNLAARLQSAAGAGEVTMARFDAELPAVAQRIAGLSSPATRETLPVKGFSEVVEVVRIRASSP